MTIDFIPTNDYIVRCPYYACKDIDLTENLLKDLIKRPSFQEAIYYASPELYAELIKYFKGILSDKKSQKMIGTLYKYAQRIHYRSTPFGMFAYCAVGIYSNSTNLSKAVKKRSNYRYDFQFLYDYVFYILKNADAKLILSLNVCTNQTIFFLNSFYYYSVMNLSGEIREVRIHKTDLLDFILTFCKENVSCQDVIAACDNLFEISFNDIILYIKELLLKGILISDIAVGTTGKDCFSKIDEKLRNLNPKLLNEMRYTLNLLKENNTFDTKLKAINLLFNKAQSLGIKINNKRFIQVDSYSDEIVIINNSVKAQLKEWFDLLLTIIPPLGNPMTDFINRFTTRYEEQSIPLLTALNKKVGLGYNYNSQSTSVFINNVLTAKRKKTGRKLIQTYNLTVIEQVVLEHILKKSNLYSINTVYLSYDDFKEYRQIPGSDHTLSYTCMYKIVGYNEKGPLLADVGFSGTSASCLITRFSDGLDGISNILTNIANKEQKSRNNAILAEISHLSYPHAGNVQIRPSFRNFEIPYLSYSENQQKTINLEDILIKVNEGKIKLYSKSKDKEVIPCFSSAFNYKFHSTDLYQFLGDVQHQNAIRSLNITFDALIRLFKHVPRVYYKNIIVSPEMWLLNNEWKNLELKESMRVLRVIQKSLRLPKHLTYSQGDNYFVINFDSDLSLKEFSNLSKKEDRIILKEFLPLSNDIKHYDSVTEIIQPFIPKM